MATKKTLEGINLPKAIVRAHLILLVLYSLFATLSGHLDSTVYGMLVYVIALSVFLLALLLGYILVDGILLPCLGQLKEILSD